MSREDSSTPETDVSSIPDPAFEEVRARLELLSPKNDSHQFNGFLQPDWSGSSSSAWQMQEQTKYATAEAQYPRSSFKSREIANIQTTPGTPAMHLTPRKEVDQSQVETSVRLDAHQEDTNESNIHPLQRRCALENQQPRPRSLASIAMSEIPDMYADLPSPGTTARNTLSAEDVERMISADAAEIVLLRILESLDNLQDLFSTATVSRGFYRTFKRHELPLMKNALYGMSPAAWELREMSPPYPGLMDGADSRHTLDYTPSLYLQHYMRDMYTMIALKSMILIHCESFLRADTITALAGGETERASQIDDAFWRVWTFCQIFGCGSKREDDIVGQMDWLRGGVLAKSQRRIAKAVEIGANVSQTNALHNLPPTFGNGNGAGLSAEDLYDMTEIWTSLGVLVRGFQGKRHEAREFGIFQNSNVTAGDVEQEDAVLGMYLSLSLGLYFC